MRRLQLLLVLGNWLGSLLFGWLNLLWWVAVPPITFGIFAFGMTAYTESYGRSIGFKPGRYAKQMLGPNVFLVIWNTIINSVIFACSWGASLLFRAA